MLHILSINYDPGEEAWEIYGVDSEDQWETRMFFTWNELTLDRIRIMFNNASASYARHREQVKQEG
jgi:hypothetical protein